MSDPSQVDLSNMAFDPTMINLDAIKSSDDDLMADWVRQITCYLNDADPTYNDTYYGARISSIFVVLVLSSAVTFFPVLATRSKKVKVPLYVYLFARYFGAGVIVATAFIHLLDPAYSEIGPATCVGMTGGWAEYSWVPALALTSCMLVFLMDFGAECYVEKKYGLAHSHGDGQGHKKSVDAAMLKYEISREQRPSVTVGVHDHSNDQNPQNNSYGKETSEENSITSSEESLAEKSFQTQIAAFMILEFGVIFHSVIIGLALGSAGDEFATLYPVIVFHQAFEGMGVGARLSAIQFPRRLHWMPWALCASYGVTTPIAIAIGFGLRMTYAPGSFTASVVSGVLDSISAGILIYTGLVELLARDFLFNPDRTRDTKQLTFMIVCVFLGAGIMALLGKWA